MYAKCRAEGVKQEVPEVFCKLIFIVQLVHLARIEKALDNNFVAILKEGKHSLLATYYVLKPSTIEQSDVINCIFVEHHDTNRELC